MACSGRAGVLPPLDRSVSIISPSERPASLAYRIATPPPRGTLLPQLRRRVHLGIEVGDDVLER